MAIEADRGELSPARARAAFRAGTAEPTSGWCAGFAQANLIAVPADWAYDVLLFCQRNPKPCPILDVTDPGDTGTVLAEDADLRTDLPGYRVWRNGELVAEPNDVKSLWRKDLVVLPDRVQLHLRDRADRGLVAVAACRAATQRVHVRDRPAVPTGGADSRADGGVDAADPGGSGRHRDPADRADAAVHGDPVHVGDPGGLGIADLGRPDFGDAVRAEPDDVPVFWACGVTPQAAVMASRPPFAITHQPGHMFVTDVPDADYRVC